MLVHVHNSLTCTSLVYINNCTYIVHSLSIIFLHTSFILLQVIAGKLGMDAAAFAELGSEVYLMHHRTKKQAKWVGLSPDLCRTLCGHFFQLYHKECSQLNPIEVELKFFTPLAADWDI